MIGVPAWLRPSHAEFQHPCHHLYCHCFEILPLGNVAASQLSRVPVRASGDLRALRASGIRASGDLHALRAFGIRASRLTGKRQLAATATRSSSSSPATSSPAGIRCTVAPALAESRAERRLHCDKDGPFTARVEDSRAWTGHKRVHHHQQEGRTTAIGGRAAPISLSRMSSRRLFSYPGHGSCV